MVTKEGAAKLTPRQRQCLDLFARHLDSQQIAGELGISVHTVENHFAAILRELGANNRRDAARIYLADKEKASASTSGIPTSQLPVSDFPSRCPSLDCTPSVREVAVPAGYDTGPTSPESRRERDSDPLTNKLKIAALIALLAATIAILAIALPGLGSSAQYLADRIQSHHQHE